MASLIFRGAMLAQAAFQWSALSRAAEQPGIAQRKALRNILSANRSSEFGTEHSFSTIQTPQEYRRGVPVQEYETLRPYIERQRHSRTPSLTAAAPLFYAQTSGSTGKPKYIPISAPALQAHRKEQGLFTYLQYRACPSAFDGKAFGVMGPAVEGVLDSGHQVGSVSGYLYQSLPRSLQVRFVLPPKISEIGDYALKYLVMLRLALAHDDITYLGSPNPSTFLRLLEILNTQRDLLVRSFETGTFPVAEGLDPAIREVVMPRIQADRRRASQLGQDKILTFGDLWPRIRLLTTWTGGTCGIALERLRPMLPAGAQVMELGYQATECRGTMALEPETPGGLPPLHHHYFEFIEQDDWDLGGGSFLSLEELREKRRYYIVVTTIGGLYRYFMNDLVETAGRFRNTPLLRFVQKGRGVTSLTGEKLYEAQVLEAVQHIVTRYRLTAPFFMLVADEERSSYRLFLEREQSIDLPPAEVAADLDKRLGDLNLEYHSKRASGRLAPLTIAWVRQGAGEAYRAACVESGQREGQFKPVVLQYRSKLMVPLEQYVVD